MPEEWIEATQSAIGAIIKKPKLTEERLKKPPFKYLHDIIKGVLQATGYAADLFDQSELDSSSISVRLWINSSFSPPHKLSITRTNFSHNSPALFSKWIFPALFFHLMDIFRISGSGWQGWVLDQNNEASGQGYGDQGTVQAIEGCGGNGGRKHQRFSGYVCRRFSGTKKLKTKLSFVWGIQCVIVGTIRLIAVYSLRKQLTNQKAFYLLNMQWYSLSPWDPVSHSGSPPCLTFCVLSPCVSPSVSPCLSPCACSWPALTHTLFCLLCRGEFPKRPRRKILEEKREPRKVRQVMEKHKVFPLTLSYGLTEKKSAAADGEELTEGKKKSKKKKAAVRKIEKTTSGWLVDWFESSLMSDQSSLVSLPWVSLFPFFLSPPCLFPFVSLSGLDQ